MPSFIIQLHNLRVFGYHGLYAEEKILGTEFELNIKMKVDAAKEEKISIHDTIDYAVVYELIRKIFEERHDLLETVCVQLTKAIKEAYPKTKTILLQIKKLHPPIATFEGAVSVSYKKKFK